MAKKPKKEDALVGLLKVASPAVLTDLILKLATDRPDIRRECFDFLKTRVSVSKALEKYKAFKKMCQAAEWAQFEPKILARLRDAWRTEKLKIRIGVKPN